MDFEGYKQRLLSILKEEKLLEDRQSVLELERKSILDKMLPFIQSDTYSADGFSLRKDIKLEYDLNDPELIDYTKEKNTAIDLGRLKRAIKAGIQFTNVRQKEVLIAYKKKNDL